jgi:Fic family protein
MQESLWTPHYAITPAVANALMKIEAARAVVAHTPLPAAMEARLRERARLRSTHYSTYIEGNRLTLAETREAVEQRGVTFHGRERDVAEVRHYWQALLRMEAWAAKGQPLTEELLRRLHALVEYGPHAKATAYRDGQNAIRDSLSGALVYLPPEARDVPALMTQLVYWARHAEETGLPVPLIAALTHYQFVTIHPYYDGNGRTARLLATFLLQRGGYGLNGFFSLEEHHARDLDAYYRALATHPHHNYYLGRAQAELTPWLEYFTALLARDFSLAQEEALACAREGLPAEPEALRQLDHRARTVLALFARHDEITTAMVAAALGLSPRMARTLVSGWMHDGWLQPATTAKKNRAYYLTALYRQFIGILSATDNTDMAR